MDSSLNDIIFLQLIFSYKNDTLTVCFGKEDSFIRKKARAKLAAVASGDIGISYCQEVSTAGFCPASVFARYRLGIKTKQEEKS